MCCRTCAFQVMYMLLVVTFHSVVIHDGLRVVLMAEPRQNHLIWVFVLLFTNLFLYIVCCHSDPGDLAANSYLLQRCHDTYNFDGTMYRQGLTCSTCDIVKPARSKHCRKYCAHVTLMCSVLQWWIQRGRGGCPLLAQFFQKAAFYRVKGIYFVVCICDK